MPRKSAKSASKAVEEVYEMEDVVDYTVDADGVERFLVKWKGYPASQNTWEPEDNILEPSANMRARMVALRNAAKEAEKPKSSRRKAPAPAAEPAPPAAAKSRSKPSTTKEPKAAAAATVSEPRGTKRRPPPPAASHDDEEESEDDSRRAPAGAVSVWHMGRGPEEAVDEYKVTLKWENDYQVIRSVSYVREKYPEALLDYLLSRVRFRK